ncbi:hypothetical protein HOK00_07800 [bacterium]|jgi:predicted patatin/cPLA2 family phospholipase|nr:hypothetical protein [bacterium]
MCKSTKFMCVKVMLKKYIVRYMEIHKIIKKNTICKLNNKTDICCILDDELYQILNDTNNKKNILVLSGGGVKGIAHVGALKAFEQLGMLKDFDTFSCTSVGGIVGLFISCGLKPDYIYKLLNIIGIDKLRSNKKSNFIQTYGVDIGEQFTTIISTILKEHGIKEDITFKEHFEKTRKKLILTGTCINEKKIYYFSVDTFPDMKLLTALRITISVPIIFSPVLFENKLFIDGGCIDNYPIKLFDNNLDNVVGVFLDDETNEYKNINNLEDYLVGIFDCLYESIHFNLCRGYEECTIKIKINCPFDFNINKEKLNEIYLKGYNAVIK